MKTLIDFVIQHRVLTGSEVATIPTTETIDDWLSTDIAKAGMAVNVDNNKIYFRGSSILSNETSHWNANKIDGNDATIGTAGAPEDGYVIKWDDANSKFVLAAETGGSDTNFANANLTFDANRNHDLAGFNMVLDNAGTDLFSVASTGNIVLGNSGSVDYVRYNQAQKGIELYNKVFDASPALNASLYAFEAAGNSGGQLKTYFEKGSTGVTNITTYLGDYTGDQGALEIYKAGTRVSRFTGDVSTMSGSKLVIGSTNNADNTALLSLTNQISGGYSNAISARDYAGGSLYRCYTLDNTGNGNGACRFTGYKRSTTTNIGFRLSSHDEISYIDTTGVFALGKSTGSARLDVKSTGSTSSTHGLAVENSASTQNFAVRDDGVCLFRSFTVATAPATATAGGFIYVSDEVGGAVMAFGDGTNWRRVTDRAIIS